MEKHIRITPQNSLSAEKSNSKAADTQHLLNTAIIRQITPAEFENNYTNSNKNFPRMSRTTIKTNHSRQSNNNFYLNNIALNSNEVLIHQPKPIETFKGDNTFEKYQFFAHQSEQKRTLPSKKLSNNFALTSQQSSIILIHKDLKSTNKKKLLENKSYYQRNSSEQSSKIDNDKDNRKFNKKLLRLRDSYQRKKQKLLRSKQISVSTDSIDSFDRMYPEDSKKLTCQEIMFSKRMRKWVFWFIVAFLAALTIKDVISLIIEYSGHPKQSDINIMFNESMTMPNITFCMNRAQAWSHFRLNTNETPTEWDKKIQDQLMNMTDKISFLSTPWDYRMVMETYNIISVLTSMERETTIKGSANTIYKFGKQDGFKTLRKNLKMWIDVLNKRKVSFEEFTQKIGKETLKRSMQRFQRTSYKENEIIKTDIRISWISQLQLCYQPIFDANNYKSIKDQGNFFLMVLSHDAEKLNNIQVECMTIDFHGRASSSSRFSSTKGQARDGFNDELCMGMVHETTVEVKARYKMLPNDEQGTACRDQEDGQDSEFDCHARCRMKFIKEICKCTAPTLSYLLNDDELKKTPLCDYSTCKINVQTLNYTDNDCTNKCFRDCNQIRYEIDHERKGKSMRPDLTTIYLNWGSFEYLTLEQDWVWSVSTFIAALGGSIGMWLGLSILSLIQGGTYMYTYLTQNVIKKHRQSTTVLDTAMGPKTSIVSATNTVADSTIAANPFLSPFKPKTSANKSPPPEYK